MGVGDIEHDFPLNGNREEPEIKGGVAQMVKTYKEHVRDVQ